MKRLESKQLADLLEACPSGICLDIAAAELLAVRLLRRRSVALNSQDSHLLVAAYLVQRLRDDIFKETGMRMHRTGQYK